MSDSLEQLAARLRRGDVNERGLALGELTWANSRKALFKEVAVGLGNGVSLGLLAAVVAWIAQAPPALGLVLGSSMIINMFVAAAAGTLIPLGLKAMKADPRFIFRVSAEASRAVDFFLSFSRQPATEADEALVV